MVVQAEALPRAVRAAFRAMSTGRPGAAHLGLPLDVQRAELDDDELWGTPELGRFPAWRTGSDPQSIESIVALLRDAKSPLIICGGGVVLSGAEGELANFVESLGMPVATTVSGQGSLSDQHPLSLGVVGSNGGTAATRAVVEASDLILFLCCRAGSVTTERWRYPRPGQAKIVQIDVDPAVIGANYQPDAAAVGDIRLILQQLNAALDGYQIGADMLSAAQARVAKAKDEKRQAFEALATSDEAPIRPERLIATLQSVLDDDAIIVADPGTPCPYFSAHYSWPKAGRHFITNRAHGALGFALAGAMGAQVGRPDAKVVSVMGDGSFGMSVGELETAVRLNLPVTFVVISNAVFGWIKAGQKSGFGERYYSVDFGRTDHAKVAAGFGMESWRVEDPQELEATLTKAVSRSGPTLVDVVCQPLQEAAAPVSEWIA